jgi:hypothetical protein
VEKYASLLLTESYDACEVACWKAKAADTHTEYEISVALPQQQWLRGSASVLRLYVRTLTVFYLYVSCGFHNKQIFLS